MGPPHGFLKSHSARLVAVVVALSLAGLGAAGAAGAGTIDFQPAAASKSAATTLKRGSRGALVRALQRALGIQVTGYYGPKTVRAVRAFQRRHGLKPDGIAGRRTLRALGISTRSRGSRPKPLTGGVTPDHAPDIPPDAKELLDKIAQCESGGNPKAIGGGGRYRGKYQFTMDTWRAYGGTGDPIDAPENVQDLIAYRLLKAVGTSAWPHCGEVARQS